MNAVGQAVVAWAGNGTGDGSGVFFQRYATALVVDTASERLRRRFASGTIPPRSAQLLSNKGTDGKISLREAIIAANNTANANANSPDRIYFNIAGAGAAHDRLDLGVAEHDRRSSSMAPARPTSPARQ